MKNTLLNASLLLTIAVGLFLFSSSDEPAYSPRKKAATVQDWSGAKQIQLELHADPETGEIDHASRKLIESALAQRDAVGMKSSADLTWISAGPNNVGGRTRAIETHPSNPNEVYAGSVTGGLFKSTSGGGIWEQVESFDEHLSISSIAITGNGRIYVATGCRFEGFVGNGLYASDDGGLTFDHVLDFFPSSTFATNDDWSYVTEIELDPVDTEKIWICYEGGIGTFKAGDSDITDMSPTSSGFAYSFDISNDGQTIIATYSHRVYVSTDAGNTWTDKSGSNFGEVPTGSRVEVALSKDDPSHMYAIVVQGGGGTLRGVFSSENAGETFYEIAPSSNGGTAPFSPFVSLAGQGVYDCEIAVVPGSPDEVIIGGIRLHKYVQTQENPPAGQWSDMNQNFTIGPSLNYVHSDIHDLHFDANGVMYIGCDGGVFKSFDNGVTFVSQSFNYITTQYYGIGYNYLGHMIGGTQDNGSHIITGFGNTPQSAEQVRGGDGFDCEMSQFDPTFSVTTIYNNDVARSFDFGDTYQNFVNVDSIPGPFWTRVKLYENFDDPNSNSTVRIFTTLKAPGDSTIVVGDTLSYYNVITAGTDIEYTSANYNRALSVNTSDLPLADSLPLWTEPTATFPAGEIEEVMAPYWKDTTISISGTVIDFIDTTTLTTIDTMTITTYEYIDTMIWVVVNNDSSLFHLIDSIPMMMDTVVTNTTLTIDTFYTNGFIDVPDSFLVTFVDLPDPTQTLFAVGSSAAQFGLTRDAVKSLVATPSFAYISGNGFGGTASCFEFSLDGDVLYIGTGGGAGRVYRISGLSTAATAAELEAAAAATMTQIYGGSGGITDMSLDPTNQNRLAISKSGYGTNAKVLFTENASTAAGTTSQGTFEEAWDMPGDLNRMPCYSILYDKENPGRLIAGTEYGTWISDNEGNSWTECNIGMGRTPVYDLRQQIFTTGDNPNMLNEGAIYAGSFGRGIFYAGDYILSVDEVEENATAGLTIFPNPMIDQGALRINLTERLPVTIEIYDIKGKKVMTDNVGTLEQGEQTVRFDVSELGSGSYILNVVTGQHNETGRFVIMR